MAATLVPDTLWQAIEPHLPRHPRSPKGGRPRVSDRACLSGIIFVLRTGIPWNLLPPDFGCGDGVTCWRRFDEWRRAGVWLLIHELLIRELGQEGQVDLTFATIDSASVRALFGGPTQAPTPRIVPRRAANGMS